MSEEFITNMNMTNKPDFPVVTDDISLMGIFRQLIRFVKNARKHLLIGVLLGIVTGVVLFIVTKPVYESTMSAYSSNLSDSKAIAVIDDLAKLFIQKDFEQLSQKMELKPSTLEKITKISVVRSKTTGNMYEETEQKLGFEITAQVQEVELFDSVEYGIRNHIENLEYVKPRVSSYKSNLAFNIEKLESEIKDMLVLKANLHDILNNTNGSIKNQPNIFLSDLGNTNLRIIELYEKQNRLKEELILASDFGIIRKFTKFKKRVSPRLSKTLLFTEFICITIAILVYFWKPMVQFVKNS